MLRKIITFFNNKSLSFKLNISLLLSLILSSVVLSIFVSNYSKPLLKEQVISEAYKSLGEINYGIDRGIDIVEQSMVNTANILSLDEKLSEKELLILSNAALKSIREQYGYFYEFFIFIPSNDGKHNGVLYYSCLKNGEINTVPWRERNFIRDREWLHSALKSGNIQWSEPYHSIDPDNNDILSTTVSMPFKFKNSKTWDGVIAASGNLDDLRHSITSSSFKLDGKFLMTSEKGLYLVHPDNSIELKKTIYDVAKKINSKELIFAAEQIQQGKSGFVDMKKSSVYNKGEVVFVYMPVHKTKWGSFLVYSSENFYKPVRHFQFIYISFTAIGLLILMLLVNRICRYTTNPIVELAKVADKYGKGEFSTELPLIQSDDEVGVLTQAFYNMKDNLLNLINKQKENAQEEQKRASELEISAKIQSSALPTNFPKNNHFDIFATMNPAKEVGGDFYDFFFIDDNHFAFLIADVSGKGIPAALFMMNAKSLLKSNIKSDLPLAEAVSKTNNELCASNNAKMFVTAFIAVLDIKTGELTYVNAGHNPPLIKTNGTYEYLKTNSNIVISAIDDFEYKSETLILKPHDGIFVYTDGVVEAQNSKAELYNEERLINNLNKMNLEPSELLPNIKKTIDDFSEDIPQFDDITMLNLIYLN